MELIYKTDNGKLIQGDNIEIMEKIKDNIYDSCISDFPYDLKFMGKKWDNTGNFYDWCNKRAIQLYRIIKPGGYVCIFGHPKTNHRMKCAFEDVGFNIVEEIDWIYGCLSEDTEVLTNNGWKKYNEIQYDDLIMSWDNNNDILEFNKIDDILIKEHEEEMIQFKNDDTDQLLTSNHRVYQKSRIIKMIDGQRNITFEKDWNVKIAEDINRWNTINLPLSSYHEGIGIGGNDYAELLGWIWSEGEFDKIGYGVRISQSSVNHDYVDNIKILFEKLNIEHKLYTRDRKYKERNYIEYTWFISGNYAKQLRDSLKNKKLSYDLIFKMTQEEKKSFLKTAKQGDGSKRDLIIYQNDIEQLEILQTMFHLVGHQARINYNKNSVAFRRSNTTQLQTRHLKNNYKKEYKGIVWCVAIENKAFIARRNNRLFITGNTGFPKNQDIGKLFDKKAGKDKDRKIIGKSDSKGIRTGSDNFVGDDYKQVGYDITEPASEQAIKWDGWKTSGLKPAHEPITIFQKPLEGTYIQNIDTYDCGAMNIDACRIPTSQDDKDVINAKASKNPTTNYSDSQNKIYGAYTEDKSMPANEIGRFPANIILDSSMGEELDNQSGISKSTGGKGDKSKGALGDSVYGKYKNEELSTNAGGLGDIGGASRYFLKIEEEDFVPFLYCPKATKKEKGEGNTHVTVKPKQLIKWLIKLVTPKDGKTIDVTAGSGTHGLSCEELNKDEGYNLKWINIELLNTEKEPYCDIAKSRIEKVI